MRVTVRSVPCLGFKKNKIRAAGKMDEEEVEERDEAG